MQGEAVPEGDRRADGPADQPDLGRAGGPGDQVQGRGRGDLVRLAVDALHRLREIEAGAGPGPEKTGDLFSQPLGRGQGARAHADREHQHHRQEAGGHDQHPLQGLAGAQVVEQQGEGDQGVDRL